MTASRSVASGSLEEDLAEAEVAFGQREVEQRHEPSLLTQRGAGLFYGGWHQLDQVLVTAVVEVAEEVLSGKSGPRLLHFGIADEEAWDVGLPCGGEIDVYVERYQP